MPEVAGVEIDQDDYINAQKPYVQRLWNAYAAQLRVSEGHWTLSLERLHNAYLDACDELEICLYQNCWTRVPDSPYCKEHRT